MIPLINTDKIKRLLCIGAHPDDIELGAGGTLLRLIEANPEMHIRWVILCGGDPTRAAEARKSAALFTANAVEMHLDVHPFKDAFLPWQGEEVKQVFETLNGQFSPDLIMTHFSGDKHQDHRLIAEFTWNTWRNHAILEYEILKWDGDLGQPNTYIPLTEAQSKKKVEYIYQTYATQQSRQWFDKDNFLALMRIRGVESNAQFAEAFYSRKMVW